MATINKFNAFTNDLTSGKHDLGSDTVTVALSNTAPSATNAVLTDITEITYTGLSSRDLTTTSSSQTGGVYHYIAADLVLSSTGTVGPFRYVALYNSTSATHPLIGWLDLGSPITLNNGESLTLDFDNTNGVFTLT